MSSAHGIHPRRFGLVAAAGALLLAAALVPAASQSETQPPAAQPPATQPNAAARTALGIAGPASMTVAPPSAPSQQTAQTTTARPTPTAHEMTPEERRQFMMLLILHETSRNPMGALH